MKTLWIRQTELIRCHLLKIYSVAVTQVMMAIVNFRSDDFNLTIKRNWEQRTVCNRYETVPKWDCSNSNINSTVLNHFSLLCCVFYCVGVRNVFLVQVLPYLWIVHSLLSVWLSLTLICVTLIYLLFSSTTNYYLFTADNNVLQNSISLNDVI